MGGGITTARVLLLNTLLLRRRDPMNHYHELISLGCKTGSSVMNGFVEMAKELKKID